MTCLTFTLLSLVLEKGENKKVWYVTGYTYRPICILQLVQLNCKMSATASLVLVKKL